MANITETQNYDSVQAELKKQQDALRDTLRLDEKAGQVVGATTRFLQKRARSEARVERWRKLFS